MLFFDLKLTIKISILSGDGAGKRAKDHLREIDVGHRPRRRTNAVGDVVEHAKGDRWSASVHLDDLVRVVEGVTDLLHPLQALRFAPLLDPGVACLPHGLAVLFEADLVNAHRLAKLVEHGHRISAKDVQFPTKITELKVHVPNAFQQELEPVEPADLGPGRFPIKDEDGVQLRSRRRRH